MGLFDWLRKQDGPEPAETVSPQLVRDVTDFLIRQTDPKLALCSRYDERLAPSVGAAIRHIIASVQQMPTPCDASPDHWHSTPELAAFFVSPDELVNVFSRSEPLQALFEQNPTLDAAYAVLGTTLIERKGLGMALEGEMLRRDVVQISVSFSNPRVHIVAPDAAGLARTVAWRMFEELAMVALERIDALRDERKSLYDDRALLQMRLQMLHGHGTGFDVHEGGQDGEALKALLEENTRALAAAGAGGDALEHELEVLRGVLERAESLVSITTRTMRLTAMNVLVEGESSEPLREIRFACARAERLRPLTRAVLQVRFPRSAMRKVTMSFADASRLPI